MKYEFFWPMEHTLMFPYGVYRVPIRVHNHNFAVVWFKLRGASRAGNELISSSLDKGTYILVLSTLVHTYQA